MSRVCTSGPDRLLFASTDLAFQCQSYAGKSLASQMCGHAHKKPQPSETCNLSQYPPGFPFGALGRHPLLLVPSPGTSRSLLSQNHFSFVISFCTELSGLGLVSPIFPFQVGS